MQKVVNYAIKSIFDCLYQKLKQFVACTSLYTTMITLILWFFFLFARQFFYSGLFYGTAVAVVPL